MWLSFVISLVALLVLLFVPGYAFFRCFSWPRSLSFVVAPAFALALYTVLGVVYSKLGIACSTLVVGVIPTVILVAVCLVTLAIRRAASNACSGGARSGGARSGGASPCKARPSLADKSAARASSGEWLNIPLVLLFVGIGVIVTFFVLIKPMDGAADFVATYDNYFHYNSIRAFFDSGQWNTFDVSSYLGAAAGVNPMPDADYPLTGYYPMGWHLLVVMVMSLTGAAEAVAINAVNFVFVGILFPLGMYQLITTLFPQRRVLVAGALVCFAFAVFPWHLMITWPLFPNAAGICITPTLLSCFILFLESALHVEPAPARNETQLGGEKSAAGQVKPIERTHPVAYLAAFVVCCAGCATIHPNTIFTAAVFLAPFLVWTIGRVVRKRRGVSWGVFAFLAAIAGVVAVWVVCFNLPMFSSAVNEIIPWHQWHREALEAVVSFSFTNDWMGQPLLVILMALGAVACAVKRRRFWVVFSLAFACLVYFVAASMDECLLKHVIAGFWYTEPRRICSIVILAAVPLAAMGLAFVYDGIVLLANKFEDKKALRSKARPATIALCAVVACVFYVIPLIGAENQAGAEDKSGWSPLRTMTALAAENYAQNTYSDAEQAFVERVIEQTNGALVVNIPYDGSVCAYGISGLNALYRERWGYGDGLDTPESALIRTHLNEISTNAAVATAVKSTGARYVMQLHVGSEYAYGTQAEEFNGVSAITESTPGFTLVLAEGDCKLFRIN